MRETQVRSLGWEDPLEKEMAIHFLAWKIQWMEDPGRLQSMGLQRVGHDFTLISLGYIILILTLKNQHFISLHSFCVFLISEENSYVILIIVILQVR